jgi:exopolysaccharide biosynthesis polyprenyl glycosylphosphotransferase
LIPRPAAANRWLLYELIGFDLLILVSSSLLASQVFPSWGIPQSTIPVYAVLVTLFAFSEGLYKDIGATAAAEFPVLARSASFAMALVLVAAWDAMQPLGALVTLGASLGGVTACRQLRTRRWRDRGGETESRNVLIVGAGPTARAIARGLREDPFHRSHVAGFLDDTAPLSPQVLGRISDLEWMARAQFIDEVILAVPNEAALMRTAADVAFRNHLDIRVVPELPSGPWPDAGVGRIGGVPVITLHQESLPSATLFLKRLLDLLGAAVGLVLVGPVMAWLVLLIRLDSPGPIFYSAERTGAKGRTFRCYKFRSMTSGADQLKETLRARNQREGPIFKLADDPRITRFGYFLRRYSLDELPQLWNVLCGEMSLVGPRPHPVEEVNHYELHHYRRLDMKPGMTGLWQVTARSSPSFDLNMHLDLTYIENWTLALDLRILLSTVRVLFSPEGA